jgi:acyl-CoA synthetase (AMP-forming)/AMP-acid ligase II
MNIVEILREQAGRAGDAPAIVDRHGPTGFAELDRAAAAAARGLLEAGVRAGDRVLVLVPVSVPLYAVLIGLFRMGATAVLLDPSAGRDHVERCCALARPRAFVGAPIAHVLRLVSRAVRQIPLALTAGGRLPLVRHLPTASQAPADGSVAPAAADTPALLTFTSGSTGAPKGVVRSHGFLLAQHRALEESLSLRPGDVQLTALPVFVLSNLAAGVTSVLPDADLRHPGRIDAAPVLMQIRQHRVRSMVASPAFLERVVDAARGTDDLGGVERIFTGGAPVFPRLLRGLADVAPRAALTAVYGSTEAEPIAKIRVDAIGAEDAAAMRRGAGLLAGAVVPASDVQVISDRFGTPIGPFEPPAFEAGALAAGEIGEIVVAGDHVLTSYLDGAGESETKFRVGSRVWHRTGDAGYFDARGRLWLVGRCRACIRDEAGTIYPFPVETAALELPEVRRAAFVSTGGRRVLVVEVDAGASLEAVRGRLLNDLAWSGIAEVRSLARIPVDRRHNAKIDYPELIRRLGG